MWYFQTPSDLCGTRRCKERKDLLLQVCSVSSFRSTNMLDIILPVFFTNLFFQLNRALGPLGRDRERSSYFETHLLEEVVFPYVGTFPHVVKVSKMDCFEEPSIRFTIREGSFRQRTFVRTTIIVN